MTDEWDNFESPQDRAAREVRERREELAREERAIGAGHGACRCMNLAGTRYP